MTTPGLAGITQAFDRLAGSGRTVGLWWRDDDAVAAGPALERLLGLSALHGAPLALAVVPARVEPSLVERVRGEARVAILPHGLTHANHAPPDERPAEFGDHRPLAAMIADLRHARSLVRSRFGGQALDVFVPPWNRIAPALADALPGLGYAALSAMAGTERAAAAMTRLDAHLDPVDWRGSRGLRPAAGLVADLERALESGADTIGLLTHHLVLDEAGWAWCEALIGLAMEHPAVMVAGVGEFLAGAGGARDGRASGHAPMERAA